MASAAVSCYSAGRSSVHLLSISGNQSVSRLYGSVSHLSFNPISPWSGLKRLRINLPKIFSKRELVKRCRGKTIYASLFGVGAPEALVIGVVALLVFGPKGLAEVARNLGKTLRAFQPTIRELQDVSREFKSTLEREIGLDEVASTTSNTYKSVANESPKPTVDPNGSPSTPKAYTNEELLQVTDDQLASAVKTDEQTETSEQQIQVSQAEGSGIGTASASAEVAEGEQSQLSEEKLEPHQILQKLLREQQSRGTEG